MVNKIRAEVVVHLLIEAIAKLIHVVIAYTSVSSEGLQELEVAVRGAGDVKQLGSFSTGRSIARVYTPPIETLA